MIVQYNNYIAGVCSQQVAQLPLFCNTQVPHFNEWNDQKVCQIKAMAVVSLALFYI